MKKLFANNILRYFFIVIVGIVFFIFLFFVIVAVLKGIKWFDAHTISIELYEYPDTGYKYELLDEGIIELKEKKESGGNWGSGADVTWVFKIIKPGRVRIKWVYPDTTKEWKNADCWIDTYTIKEDFTYSVERYYLDEWLNYFLCYANRTEKGIIIEGYFVDINGDRRFYSIVDDNKKLCRVSDLYNYLMEHFSEYTPISFLGNEGLKKCNEKLMQINSDLYDTEMDFKYGQRVLYGVNDSDGQIRYLICASDENASLKVDEIADIIEVFGDAWNQYEP